MNLFRIINYGFIFFNNFHQSSAVRSVLSITKLGLTPSVSFSSFYNSSKSLDLCKLMPIYNPSVSTSRGMKVRGTLQLRCKDCYLVRKDGIMYVMCSSYPRHKQVALTKRPKYTWILTHASQSKYRPY